MTWATEKPRSDWQIIEEFHRDLTFENEEFSGYVKCRKATIGPDAHVIGEIIAHDIVILKGGVVQAPVSARRIRIEEGGCLDSEVRAHTVRNSGEVSGLIVADTYIGLENSIFNGAVFVENFINEKGASFHGRLETIVDILDASDQIDKARDWMVKTGHLQTDVTSAETLAVSFERIETQMKALMEMIGKQSNSSVDPVNSQVTTKPGNVDVVAAKPDEGRGFAAVRSDGGRGSASVKPDEGRGFAAVRSDGGRGSASVKPDEGRRIRPFLIDQDG